MRIQLNSEHFEMAGVLFEPTKSKRFPEHRDKHEHNFTDFTATRFHASKRHVATYPIYYTGRTHPRAPVTAAADYVSSSTSHQYPWQVSLQNSWFELSQLSRSRRMWSASGLVL